MSTTNANCYKPPFPACEKALGSISQDNTTGIITHDDGEGSQTTSNVVSGNGSNTLNIISVGPDGGAFLDCSNLRDCINPIALNDEYTTPFNTNLNGDVSVNDVSVDGSPSSSYALVSDDTGTDGALAFNTDGTFLFNPANQFCGETTFTYNCIDAEGNISNTATVTIVVECLTPISTIETDNDGTDGDWDVTVGLRGCGGFVLGSDDTFVIAFKVLGFGTYEAEFNVGDDIGTDTPISDTGSLPFADIAAHITNGGIIDGATITLDKEAWANATGNVYGSASAWNKEAARNIEVCITGTDTSCDKTSNTATDLIEKTKAFQTSAYASGDYANSTRFTTSYYVVPGYEAYPGNIDINVGGVSYPNVTSNTGTAPIYRYFERNDIAPLTAPFGLFNLSSTRPNGLSASIFGQNNQADLDDTVAIGLVPIVFNSNTFQMDWEDRVRVQNFANNAPVQYDTYINGVNITSVALQGIFEENVANTFTFPNCGIYNIKTVVEMADGSNLVHDYQVEISFAY